ncbi:MAG: hypothetical protein JWR11_2060 [Mycobacterium sp.]|jgi:hypothetical protein|nr:hypothetical protein [Mycobacterium sp.]MDT5067622.1 hypothetical protein [Mycobacterium sp.]
MEAMSETVDYPSEPTTAPQPMVPHSGQFVPPQYPQAPPPYKPSRLNKVAAWVGIVAGSLVIIAVLFGSGFYLGRETAPQVSSRPPATDFPQGNNPMIIPLPQGQFPGPGPRIIIPNGPSGPSGPGGQNGPTFQLPSIFPQFPFPIPSQPSEPPTRPGG